MPVLGPWPPLTAVPEPPHCHLVVWLSPIASLPHRPSLSAWPCLRDRGCWPQFPQLCTRGARQEDLNVWDAAWWRRFQCPHAHRLFPLAFGLLSRALLAWSAALSSIRWVGQRQGFPWLMCCELVSLRRQAALPTVAAARASLLLAIPLLLPSHARRPGRAASTAPPA